MATSWAASVSEAAKAENPEAMLRIKALLATDVTALIVRPLEENGLN